MSNDRALRTAIFALTALAAAAGAGYLVGRTGDEAAPAAPGRPPVTAAASPATGAAPAAPAAVPAAQRDPARPHRVAPPAAPAPGPESDAAGAEPTPPRVETSMVVPAGTKILLRLETGVSSQTAAIGDPVRAQVAEAVVVDGTTAIPAGALAYGRVSDAHAIRKIGGQARLAIAFESVAVSGRTVAIQAAFAREGKSETGKDAATIAAGAAVGTVLGNQAKHNDRGKVLGGLIGAGVGTAIAASTPGETIELGAGTTLRLTLRSDAEVRVPAG